MDNSLTCQRLKEFIGSYVPLSHIELHLKYKTCLWLEKDGEIVAYVQFNVDKEEAHITYLKIKKGLDSFKVMQYFIREGKRRFPYAKKIRFEREIIGDLRQRTFKIA